ncbi:hypothetical protein IWW39_001052 [Coemansia spiralis]|uniref:Rab-GAP TBC domain-containing protein n=1 Tax=Coemansia spiralis TaxID=417178 RepID=A0A9W8GN95_9FUNG|nr:hypothetical protein IWW39_001052 [Coemansia spiralis]
MVLALSPELGRRPRVNSAAGKTGRTVTSSESSSATVAAMDGETGGIGATATRDNNVRDSVAVEGGEQCDECCNGCSAADNVSSDIGINGSGEAKRLSDRNYGDRFGSYYEYAAIAESDENKAARNDAVQARQRRANAAPLVALPKVPPPLRSTYRSEPVMQARALGDGRNSYSQTLENALFYSQAIRQIRETDCVDALDPYAVAVPRARPGKEDIRQRRARNVIASREVFSITTPSAFIPLPSAGKAGPAGMWALEDMPQLPAMRSEPAIRLAARQKPSGAVPISRMLPAGSSSSAAMAPGFFGSGAAQESAWEAARRAGIDQPLPAQAEFAATMPRTAASSIITSRSVQLRQRRLSSAESAVAGAGSDDEYVAVPDRRTSTMTPTSRTQFRLSMASHYSLASGASHAPEAQHQGRRAHSRQVATRLLMRAGFSSIAIRVAGLGRAPAATTLGRSHGALADDCDAGVDLDPNGLQALRAERRKQVKRVDEYGFLQFEGDDERPSEYARQFEAWRGRGQAGQPGAVPKLAAGSEAKWETLLRSFDSATLRGSRRVKQLVQAGVPQRMRAHVYYALSGAAQLERADEYARLLALAPVPIFDVIERDVARCYPDHAMFVDAEGAGQRQLRRVLRAYAHYNAGVGYCQGMGRLVGLLLIVGLAEEQAFWVLAATIENYIPQYYVADLAGLRVHTAVFEALLQERSPRLHAHLAEEGCDALMYATPWFMTVFTLSLPWPAALRVWDWFMYRGTKVLFRVALAITDLAAAYLLEACPSITELLGFLLHIPHSLVDADVLMAAAAKVKISERHVDRLTAKVSARMSK